MDLMAVGLPSTWLPALCAPKLEHLPMFLMVSGGKKRKKKKKRKTVGQHLQHLFTLGKRNRETWANRVHPTVCPCGGG